MTDASPITQVPAETRALRLRRLRPALIGAGLLGVFGMLAHKVNEGDTLGVDTTILLWFRTPGNPKDPIGPTWVEEAVRDVTSLGSFSLLGLITAVVAINMFLRGKTRTAWYLIFCVVTGTIISTVLKALFDRPRPDFTEVARVFSASFPSGHATMTAVVYLTIGVLVSEAADEPRLKRYYMGLAIVLTAVVGVSRIYMGVHYPTDVLAGWMLGSAWAILCWTGAELLIRRTRASSTD